MCELNISLTQINKKKKKKTNYKTQKKKKILVKVLNEEHILSIELSFIFVKLDNTARIGLV